jgi:hypothetical protein
MDTIRLRTLTEKSILGFGRHADLKVGDILKTFKFRYLRFVYYNCSMISFTDDILDKIYITPEYRIDKPGKNPDMCKTLNDIIDTKRPAFSKFKSESHWRKVRKGQKVSFDKRRIIRENKKMDQLRNQGHKIN